MISKNGVDLTTSPAPLPTQTAATVYMGMKNYDQF
jgi:hypothetical protein